MAITRFTIQAPAYIDNLSRSWNKKILMKLKKIISSWPTPYIYQKALCINVKLHVGQLWCVLDKKIAFRVTVHTSAILIMTVLSHSQKNFWHGWLSLEQTTYTQMQNKKCKLRKAHRKRCHDIQHNDQKA